VVKLVDAVDSKSTGH